VRYRSLQRSKNHWNDERAWRVFARKWHGEAVRRSWVIVQHESKHALSSQRLTVFQLNRKQAVKKEQIGNVRNCNNDSKMVSKLQQLNSPPIETLHVLERPMMEHP
jgi:hypothetical protein